MSNIEKELFEHLNANLSDSAKRSLSASHTSEILHCISKWVQKKLIETAFNHAKTLANKVNPPEFPNQNQTDTNSDEFAAQHEPDFLKELSKI